MQCYLQLLKDYCKFAKAANASGKLDGFGECSRSTCCCISFQSSDLLLSVITGKFVADLCPRCTDPELAVRKSALGCVQTYLQIQAVYAGENYEEDALIGAFEQLKVGKGEGGYAHSCALGALYIASF